MGAGDSSPHGARRRRRRLLARPPARAVARVRSRDSPGLTCSPCRRCFTWNRWVGAARVPRWFAVGSRAGPEFAAARTSCCDRTGSPSTLATCCAHQGGSDGSHAGGRRAGAAHSPTWLPPTTPGPSDSSGMRGIPRRCALCERHHGRTPGRSRALQRSPPRTPGGRQRVAKATQVTPRHVGCTPLPSQAGWPQALTMFHVKRARPGDAGELQGLARHRTRERLRTHVDLHAHGSRRCGARRASRTRADGGVATPTGLSPVPGPGACLT